MKTIETTIAGAQVSYIGGKPVAVITIHADPREALSMFERAPLAPGVQLGCIEERAKQLADLELAESKARAAAKKTAPAPAPAPAPAK